MTASLPPRADGSIRLTGWKEISAYLGRGVRTVQRWEKTLGMPVYRIPTGRGETVYAFSNELDSWLSVTTLGPENGTQPDEDRRDVETATGDSQAEVPAANGHAAGSRLTSTNGKSIAPNSHRPSWLNGRRLAWLAALAGVVGLVALLTLLVWRPWRALPPQPADVKLDLDTVRLLDADGKLVFSKRLPLGDPSKYHLSRSRFSNALIEDLDGDGSREVVLVAGEPGANWPTRLLAYDALGKELWNSSPRDVVRFGDKDFGPPWVAGGIVATGPDGARRFWTVWMHGQSGQFPCLLEEIDGRGRRVSEYWSAGYVESVAEGTFRGAKAVFVGAGNNDHRGASLAVFPADGVRGSAPAENPEKACRSANCSGGGPAAFLVFPRQDLPERDEQIPYVYEVRPGVSGDYRAFVYQAWLEGEAATHGMTLYDLSPDLVPLRAEFAESYIAGHRKAEAAKVIGHPFGPQDYARLWPVHVWNGQRFVPVTGQTLQSSTPPRH